MKWFLYAWMPIIAMSIAAGYRENPSVEKRIFSVSVEGRNVGRYEQVISRNGLTCRVESSSSVDIKVLVVNYQYRFRGDEEWIGADGDWNLYSLKAQADDNGVPMKCSVDPSKGKFAVSSSGGAAEVGKDMWTTTYWTLPPASLRDKPITILDLETGTVKQVRLTRIGTERSRFGELTRYSVSGGVTADLWMDSQERLVRRVMPRKGRTTTLELVSVGH